MLTTGDVDPSRVESIIDEFFAEKAVPGLAYGVVVDGVLVHSGGRGQRRVDATDVPDADTVFRIASMTKSFTATTLLTLRDDGLLSLEDPVASWVPEVAGMGLATSDSAPLTVRQLLTMSGGLPTDDPWGDRQQSLPPEQFAALVASGLRMAWPNGVTFDYSNLGYALLGRLVAAVSGQEYSEAVATRVLRPLGMTSTVYSADDPALSPDRLAIGHRAIDGTWTALPFDGYGAFAPMGGLFSTVRDLARWVGGFTDAFPARDDPEAPVSSGGHPLRRASRREMQQPHRSIAPQLVWTSIDTAPQVRAGGYGFGLFVDHDLRLGPLVGHSGGYPGFGSNMRWHPDSGVGVVVLANSTYAHAPRVAARMLLALLDKLPSVDAARAAAGTPATALSSPPLPPRSGALWPETVAAQAQAERLVWAWDDEAAAKLFAMNVDLDDALPRRAAALASLRDTLGPFTRDAGAEVTSDSPSHLAWWMRGPSGRLKLEIRLTPELAPTVQTFTVTGVPNPSPALRSAADAIAAAFADDDPRWPAALALDANLDLTNATRVVRMAAGWAGQSTVGDATAGNGSTDATFAVDGSRGRLLLALSLDPSSGAVTRFTVRPR